MSTLISRSGSIFRYLMVRVTVSSRWKSVSDRILARKHANSFDTFVPKQPCASCTTLKASLRCSPRILFRPPSLRVSFSCLQFLSPNALTLTLVFFLLFVLFSLISFFLLSFLLSLFLILSLSLSFFIRSTSLFPQCVTPLSDRQPT